MIMIRLSIPCTSTNKWK